MGKGIPAVPDFRAAGRRQWADGTAVGVAFVGRTSTATLQDVAESLARQYRRAQERLPEGFHITACYWDVESGGIELDLRSQGDLWRQFAGAGIPRDGGMAELRAAVKAGSHAFSAVICENIARAGRDMYASLLLEKELRTAGIMIFATDEPIDAAAPAGTTMLVRRIRQAEAEFFRYNLKTQMWEGLQQYAISGHNTGKCPYGYAEQRTVHPNPIKAKMGATRARLVPDPATAPWVASIFQWRVTLKMSLRGIAARLTDLHVPNPSGGPAWSEGTINGILANPKYTGRIVLGRTTNASGSRRKGELRIVKLPREYWTWADDTSTHEAIVDLPVWEAAQTIGRERGNVRDPGTRMAGRQTRVYAYRSRIRCRQCGKRMQGLPSARAKGPDVVYYVCPTKTSRPVDALKHPDHTRASVRAEVLTAGLSDFIDKYALAPGRAARLAELLPATQDAQDDLNHAQAETIKKQVKQAEASMNGIAAEMGQLAGKTDPATAAIRDRLTSQFTEQHTRKTELEAQLAALEETQPLPGNDLTLIDELPLAPRLLAQAPEHIREQLAAAFQLQAVYRHPQQQATITLTITDETPELVHALLADTRTDHDSANPLDLPPTPIIAKSLHDHALACRLRRYGWRQGLQVPW